MLLVLLSFFYLSAGQVEPEEMTPSQTLACGENSHGQLGINNREDKNVPYWTTVQPLGATLVAAAGEVSLAVTGLGKLHGWGMSLPETFVSGDGVPPIVTGGSASVVIDVLKPTQLMLLESDFVFEVARGAQHTLMALINGEIFVFGENRHGQLGTGDQQRRKRPTRIHRFAPFVTSISAGAHHSVASTSSGEVFTW